MDTTPYPAWDNQQIAHFLCRADLRVLSQPHSWLHVGVGALEAPVHVEALVPVETPESIKPLSELDTTLRNLGITMIITTTSLYLNPINQKAQQAYYLAMHFIAKISAIVACIIDKTR